MRPQRTNGKLKKLFQEIDTAKKDPEFMRELRKFIKITTS